MAAGICDVAIIGGGPAGLSAASALLRQLHTVTLFDSGSYRNSGVHHMHMFPTWNHKSPDDFRSETRNELLSYYSTLKIVQSTINRVGKLSDSCFELEDTLGKIWNARKLILACGSDDIFPNIPGYEDCWKRRIFHCLFCHGYEDRNASSSGVLAVDFCAVTAMAIHLSENAQQLTRSVTLYTNGNADLAAELKAQSSKEAPYKVESRPIVKLKLNGYDRDSIEILFHDGTSVTETFLVHNPLTKTKGPLASQLGLELTQTGDIKADAPFHQTSVRGVFAAGDCITPYKVTPGAISSGCNVGVAVSAQLQAEKFGHHAMI